MRGYKQAEPRRSFFNFRYHSPRTPLLSLFSSRESVLHLFVVYILNLFYNPISNLAMAATVVDDVFSAPTSTPSKKVSTTLKCKACFAFGILSIPRTDIYSVQAAASLEKMSIKNDSKVEKLVLIDDRQKSESPDSVEEDVEEYRKRFVGEVDLPEGEQWLFHLRRGCHNTASRHLEHVTHSDP